jgi:hypothetical protein
MQRSNEAMICFASLKKNRYISVFSVAKPRNCVVFAFIYVSETSALVNGDFLHENYEMLTAMKR